jgi:hypothetical protein
VPITMPRSGVPPLHTLPAAQNHGVAIAISPRSAKAFVFLGVGELRREHQNAVARVICWMFIVNYFWFTPANNLSTQHFIQ